MLRFETVSEEYAVSTSRSRNKDGHEVDEIHQTFRRLTNRAELILGHWFDEFLARLRALPLQRLDRVQSPGWFENEYGTDISRCMRECEEDHCRLRNVQMPLAELLKKCKFIITHGIHSKLLLRNDPALRETPRMVTVKNVKAELKLPNSIELAHTGMYVYSAQDQEIEDKYTKLMATAEFEIGDARISDKFDLDFLMSLAEYGDRCAIAYDRDVITPLAVQHEQTFRSAFPTLYRMIANVNYQVAKQLLDDRFQIPMLLQ